MALLGLPAAGRPAPPLLELLAARDSQLAAAYTMALEVRVPATYFDTGQGVEIGTGTLTSSGTAVGFTSRMRFSAPPIFRAPGSRRAYEQFDYDMQGNLVIWRRYGRQALSAPDFSGSREESRMFLISPAGNVRDADGIEQVRQYLPGDPESTYEVEPILMALGRGFAIHISQVIEERRTHSGLIALRARGTHGGGHAGVWRLTIDPRADYLVREAAFVLDGDSAALFTTRSDGRRTAGGVTIAAHGTARFILAGALPFAREVRVQRFAHHPDTTLLAVLHQRLTAEPASGVEVIDYRVQPPSRRTVGEPAQCPAPAAAR